jgi:hypothetical protein
MTSAAATGGILRDIAITPGNPAGVVPQPVLYRRDGRGVLKETLQIVPIARRAAAKGHNVIAQLAKDADPAALRGCEDFRKPLAELPFVGPPKPMDR